MWQICSRFIQPVNLFFSDILLFPSGGLSEKGGMHFAGVHLDNLQGRKGRERSDLFVLHFFVFREFLL
jgi:hypothetical protein